MGLISSATLCVTFLLLVIARSDFRVSYGISDTTTISPPKTETPNLNLIDASPAPRDGSSPANIRADSSEIGQ